MTAIAPKNTVKPATATNGPAPDRGLRDLAWKSGRFLLHFLEMLVAMQVGMGVFHLALVLVRAYSSSRALESGTALHAITMSVFMTVPMVGWMIFRGHGWRQGAEMAIAMLGPVALIGLLCQLGVDEYLPWLAGLSTPLMFLGMLAAMLYRRDHYVQARRKAVRQPEAEAELDCH